MKRPTPEELEDLIARGRKLVEDEESGRVPYDDITDTLPEAPPLPTKPGDVAVLFVPPAERSKRRRRNGGQ